MILSGKTICPGIARGIAHATDARAILAAALHIPAGATPQTEVERLHAGIGRAYVELDRVQRQLTGRVQASDVAIFGSQAGLLRDPQFIGRVEREIREQGQSAEAAVSRVVSDLYASFLASPVPLVQDKAADILDIGRRLVRCLTASSPFESEPDQGAVIVAPSLTPSQLVRYAHRGIAAVVTETCGPKSHTAILARGLGIPLVTGIPGVCDLIPHGTETIVDAAAARVIFAPTPQEDAEYQQVLARRTAEVSEEDIPPAAPVTLDGVRVRLLLNISDPSEADAVSHLGADGVGLFRTEFPYMDRAWWPSEEEGYQIYRQVATSLHDAELSIRLVDFGAEKCPPYSDIPLNRNPSLGLRGIRLLLQRADILQPQVRALARLGRERPIVVLIPMLDSLDTLAATIDALCRIVGCATREQLPFKLGTMIEVPAAALMIDEILPHVDSISVGLNDLTQYLLAADRDDEFVERYHDPLQPAVLRLLDRVVAACNAHGKPVTICGELAGDPKLTGLLLALGLRRLSVSRSSYRGVVNALTHLSVRSMEGIAAEVLKLTTAAQVRKYVLERLCEPGVN
ncbi:MAG TPA: phosphoenolpyruvate--protein phosphotransferase [Planctomycetaceae bacterium]|nr:phosphoenolpyruvate--protein phosphotransferase [Planctomycetaceae bacterium]